MYMDHPNPGQTETVPISLRLYIGVNTASMMAGKERWQVVEEAIDEWLRKNEPGALDEPAYAGYQWKNLFLPHGSVLRTVFNGKSHHCHVEGDRIVYEGSTLTPSGFVNAVGGVRRNAWKSIWVLLPDAQRWQLADTMRVRRRARAVAPAGQRTTPARPLPPPSVELSAPPDAAPPDLVPAPRIEPSAPAQAACGPIGVTAERDPGAIAAPPEAALRPAAPAPHSLTGWARKPRPRRSLAGSARRLLDLLRHELLPPRPA